MKKITLHYLLKNEVQFNIREISLEEYFDKSEAETEHRINSVPKYLHPYQYVTDDRSKLIFLNLKLVFENDIIEFKQTFWNNGMNMVTERIDRGKNDYRELIISTVIKEVDNKEEVLRLVFKDNKIYPVYHGFISENPDGSDNEEYLDLTSFKGI